MELLCRKRLRTIGTTQVVCLWNTKILEPVHKDWGNKVFWIAKWFLLLSLMSFHGVKPWWGQYPFHTFSWYVWSMVDVRGIKPCGQSYKAPTIVIYDSRVAPDSKMPHITNDARVVIYDRKMVIRLATGLINCQSKTWTFLNF